MYFIYLFSLFFFLFQSFQTAITGICSLLMLVRFCIFLAFTNSVDLWKMFALYTNSAHHSLYHHSKKTVQVFHQFIKTQQVFHLRAIRHLYVASSLPQCDKQVLVFNSLPFTINNPPNIIQKSFALKPKCLQYTAKTNELALLFQ